MVAGRLLDGSTSVWDPPAIATVDYFLKFSFNQEYLLSVELSICINFSLGTIFNPYPQYFPLCEYNFDFIFNR